MTHQELPSYDQAPAGAIRFNTDSRKLEVYTGGPVGYGTLPNGQWMQVDSFTPDIATGGTRGVFGGGYAPSPAGDINTIEYVNVDSTGNALDFGDLTYYPRACGGGASRTRGVFGGGYAGPGPNSSPTVSNTINYVTISSTGNAADFGDLTQARVSLTALSNDTRGIFNNGYTTGPTTRRNTLDYITIASTGNAQDFGDTSAAKNGSTTCASKTRGIIAGGSTPTIINTIEFVTISTLGDTADFGDLTRLTVDSAGGSNSVRGVFMGGYLAPSDGYSDIIDYITIATLGNAVDFGNLASARRQMVSSATSPVRSVIAGGQVPGGGMDNVIQYIQIPSLGDAIDFGDLTAARKIVTAISNGHGGL